MSNKNRVIRKPDNKKKPNEPVSKKGLYAAIAVVAAIAIAVVIVFAVSNKDSFTATDTTASEAETQTEQTATSETSEETDDAADATDTGSEKEESQVGNYIATIDIADYGPVTVELDASAAPITVQNFVDLAESGFYNGLTFHRIMEGFMMQGGDPLGNGTGGSSNNIKGEFTNNGVDNPISHTRGTISMARSNDMNSASSQFFICQDDATFLDGDYAGFGHVTEGMDVVDAICKAARPIDDNGTIPSEEQPVITGVTITAR